MITYDIKNHTVNHTPYSKNVWRLMFVFFYRVRVIFITVCMYCMRLKNWKVKTSSEDFLKLHHHQHVSACISMRVTLSCWTAVSSHKDTTLLFAARFFMVREGQARATIYVNGRHIWWRVIAAQQARLGVRRRFYQIGGGIRRRWWWYRRRQLALAFQRPTSAIKIQV